MAVNARTRKAMTEATKTESTAEPVAVNFAELASQQTVAKELPKIGRNTQENPFTVKVRESYERGEAYTLPAVPEAALTPVKVAIRRGATLAGLGVSIREQVTEDGIVITYMGKVRQLRNA